jgi:protein tyrosine phosphatase (PTP) superfamily phosphohydrolase (DUF442 family)
MGKLENIQDFYDLSPLALTSGQPTAEQFSLIKSAGCELIVNLAEIKEDAGLAGEGELVRSLGMDYIHIPVIWTRPLPSDLDAFFEVMEKNKGRKIYVHCIRNFRVSSFMFLYRVLKLGTDRADASLDLKIIWKPNETWGKFIEDRLQDR